LITYNLIMKSRLKTGEGVALIGLFGLLVFAFGIFWDFDLNMMMADVTQIANMKHGGYEFLVDNVVDTGDFSSLEDKGDGVYYYADGGRVKLKGIDYALASQYIDEKKYYVVRVMFDKKIDIDSVEKENVVLVRADEGATIDATDEESGDVGDGEATVDSTEEESEEVGDSEVTGDVTDEESGDVRDGEVTIDATEEESGDVGDGEATVDATDEESGDVGGGEATVDSIEEESGDVSFIPTAYASANKGNGSVTSAISSSTATGTVSVSTESAISSSTATGTVSVSTESATLSSTATGMVSPSTESAISSFTATGTVSPSTESAISSSTATGTVSPSTESATSSSSVTTSTSTSSFVVGNSDLNVIYPEFVIVSDREVVAVFSLEQDPDLGGLDGIRVSNILAFGGGNKVILSDFYLFFSDLDSYKESLFGKIEEKVVEDVDIMDDIDAFGGTNLNTVEILKHSDKEKKVFRDKKVKIKSGLSKSKAIVRYLLKNFKYKRMGERLDAGVYYFKSFSWIDSGDKVGVDGDLSADFGLVDKVGAYLPDERVYFVRFNFSKSFNVKDVDLESFVFENIDKERFVPDVLFIDDDEAILIFEDVDGVVDADFVKFSGVNDEGGKASLDGYVPFVDDLEEAKYLEKTAVVNNRYEASLNNDVVFSASQLSFGSFLSVAESDSTIAVEMAGGKSLDSKCAIMVFGNDLKYDGGSTTSAVMPIDGFELISRSSGSVPIEQSVIDNFVAQKSKSFLGFVYLEDLDTIDNGNRVVYLNMVSPPGLEKGRYSSVMSFELYCPNS